MPTTAAGIWFPDKNSNLRHEVNMATMAASIEAGIGVRLTAQESVVGLKVVGGALTIPEAAVLADYWRAEQQLAEKTRRSLGDTTRALERHRAAAAETIQELEARIAELEGQQQEAAA